MYKNHDLEEVVFGITKRCNLQCKHCYSDSQKGIQEDNLDTETILSFIRQIKRIECRLLVLSGGEPFLRDDIYSIIQYAVLQGLEVGITTNGTMVDREVIKEIKKIGAKKVRLSFSLDAPVKDIHNFIRGENCFSQVVKNIQSCVAEKLQVSVTTVICSLTLPYLPKMADFLANIGSIIWGLDRFVPIGKGKINNELKLDKNCLRKFHDTLLRILKGKKNIKIHCNDPIFIARQFLENRISVSADFSIPYRTGCTAGISSCYINQSGVVYPCTVGPMLGNLKDKKLIDIWHQDRESYQFNNRGNLKGYCGNCKLKYICGGCRINAFAETGDFYASDPCCYLYDQFQLD